MSKRSMKTRFADPRYAVWRNAVLERDGHKCRHCEEKKPLHAHHIKSYARYRHLRYEVDNGLTLCKKCHSKLHADLRSASNKRRAAKARKRKQRAAWIVAQPSPPTPKHLIRTRPTR